jgi:hypothetical protein
VTVETESIGGQLQTTDVHLPHVFFWVLQHAEPNVRMPQAVEHPEHPLDPLLEPPELLELELLDPPAATQSEPMQDMPAPQMAHGLPADPQLLSSDVPVWQVPLVSQQPLQVDAQEPPELPELLSSPLLLPPASGSPPSSLESSPEEPDEEVVESSPLEDDDEPP